MNKYIKYGDTTIDIGASFGWHTLKMAQLVGDKGRVYAFEPQKDNYDLLKKNINKNMFNNVITYNIALGHKKMQSCICYACCGSDKNSGDGFISPLMENSNIESDEYITRIGNNNLYRLNKELIQCMRLDDIEIENKVKFIKIDVQGFELMILQGGNNLIKRDRPVMVIEVENPCLANFGYSSKELFEAIHSLDYYIFLLDYEYPCDHICVPNEYLKEFEELFKYNIYSHSSNDPLTNNVEYGINRKIVML